MHFAKLYNDRINNTIINNYFTLGRTNWQKQPTIVPFQISFNFESCQTWHSKMFLTVNQSINQYSFNNTKIIRPYAYVFIQAYMVCIYTLLSSLWISRTGSASDWCSLQEALYKCIDSIIYNTYVDLCIIIRYVYTVLYNPWAHSPLVSNVLSLHH